MQDFEFDVNELLEKVRAKDDAAFEMLIARYQPLIVSSVRRTMTSRPDLPEREEEMMQEARLALYRAALSYTVGQADVTFGLYAGICIRNALTSKFLRRQNGTTCSLDLVQEREGEMASPMEDALETLIQNESVSLLYAFIRRVLSPLEYEVFRLHADGMSISEMAEKLSRNTKSVENALARAVKKLRLLLTAE